MKNKKGVIVKRQQTILQRLQKEKEVSVDQLANELGVSSLTIRRDLIEFENQGFVKRHYGGAKLIEGTLFEDPTLDVPPATGQDGTTDYRRVVAKKAAELIEEGDIIFVNSSKTALLMLDYISGKRVSVITNNGNAITSSHDPLVSIILTGGELPAMVMIDCISHHTEDPGEQVLHRSQRDHGRRRDQHGGASGNHGKQPDDRAGKGYGRHTGGS